MLSSDFYTFEKKKSKKLSFKMCDGKSLIFLLDSEKEISLKSFENET